MIPTGWHYSGGWRPRKTSGALARNEPILAEQEEIDIDIVLRDNLP
jgi:hypothetical protein